MEAIVLQCGRVFDGESPDLRNDRQLDAGTLPSQAVWKVAKA
jgi:hypothetical protein